MSLAPAWLAVAALVALRAVLGVLQAPIFPTVQGPILIRWLPPGRWALATGLTNVGLTLGGAAAAPVVMSANCWRWIAADRVMEPNAATVLTVPTASPA